MSSPNTNRLLVFLPPKRALAEGGGRGSFSPATVASYGPFDASQLSGAVGDAPLSLLPKAASVDLLFDVADVFTAQVEAPRIADSKLRQALPSLIEERLLAEAADCHFAFAIEGPGTGASPAPMLQVAVAAIDRTTLMRALDAAAQAGLRVRSASSALYSIPAPSGEVLSVRLDRGRGFARTAEHSGFAFDLESEAPAPLALAVQQLRIKRIQAYGGDASSLVHHAAQLGVEVVDLKRPFDAASTSAAVNLLQGRFAVGGRLGLPTLTALADSRLVRPAAAWAAVWLVILVAGANAYRWKLESEASALRDSMQTAFRSAFPSDAFIDPVLQTRRHLRDLRARVGQASPDDFTVLNAQAAQLLDAAPVGSLSGLEYRDAALVLKFKPGIASDPSLKNNLRAQALQQGLALRFETDNTARLAPSEP